MTTEIPFGGGSGSSFNSRSVSSDVTADPFDLLFVDASGGVRTETLPADGDTSDGDRVVVVKTDSSSNIIQVVPNTNQSIDGAPRVLEAGGEATELVYVGGTWVVKGDSASNRYYDYSNEVLDASVGTSSSPVSEGHFQSLDGQSETIGSTRISPDPNADPQTVINNAPVGATIEFDSSVRHTVSAPVVINTAGFTVEGLHLKLAGGADAALMQVAADHCTVRDCDLDGNEANQTTGTAIGQSVNGVTVTGCADVTVEQNNIYDIRDQGILATSYNAGTSGPISDVRIKDNRVENTRNGGILAQGGGSGATAEDITIRDNTVIDPANEILQAIDGVRNVTIADNYAEGDTAGMVVENHSGRNVSRSLRDVTFRNNTVIVNGRGFNVSHPEYPFEDVKLIGNHIDHNGGTKGIDTRLSGAVIRGMEIKDNTIIGDRASNFAVGMEVGTSADTFENCTISDNTIREESNAINKFTGPLETLIVEDNFIFNCTQGINMQDAPGSRIHDNVLENLDGKGITIISDQGGSGSANVYRMSVQGNDITDDGSAGVDGVQIKQDSGTMDYYVVVDNTIDVSGTAVNDSVGAANATTTPNTVV
jgi:hypothetical protein